MTSGTDPPGSFSVARSSPVFNSLAGPPACWPDRLWKLGIGGVSSGRVGAGGSRSVRGSGEGGLVCASERPGSDGGVICADALAVMKIAANAPMVCAPRLLIGEPFPQLRTGLQPACDHATRGLAFCFEVYWGAEMSRSSESGDDMEAGRANRANHTTKLWAEREEPGVDFAG